GVLDVCPGASVVIRVHTNAPYWWNEQNREECTEYADGPIETRQYGPPFNNEDGDINRALRASLASMKWRKESGGKLAELCRRLSLTPEGNAVSGMHISGGIYGEWHYWGFIDHDPDTGPAMTRFFKEWLKKKYKTDAALQRAWAAKGFTLENATVPSTIERNAASNGIFKDPAKDKRIIDYFTCQQEVVADDIEYFCKLTKESWPRPLIVGVFYGYFYMTFCRQASGGHLFIERIMNSPYIDYLSAPQSYYGASRNLGGSGNSRGVIESALLHGKLWLDEVDNGGLQKGAVFDDIRVSNVPDSNYVPMIRRSALYPLMRGIGLWYYDFGIQKGFGWWDRPLYMKNIQEEKAFFDARLNIPYKSEADALFVWDMESYYYVKNTWTPLCYDEIDKALEEVLHAGVVGDHIYLFDLDKVDLKQYKAVVFLNVHKMTAKDRAFIKDKVCRDGRTVVWNYMPGYTDGDVLNLKFVRELVDINIAAIPSREKPSVTIKDPSYTFTFSGPVNPMAMITDTKVEAIGHTTGTDTIVVARKRMPRYTSVYSVLPLHGSDVYRNILKAAGCHVYNDKTDFTYANTGLLLIHTIDGGSRTINLKNGKKLTINLPPKSSTLYNSETGERLL
ncbi:MAG TPA: hypothetical protein VM935_00840, partial [Chitinophagaceae bacterium]|nr:hypothetical protein [Chitinophagaceae bacterium]